MKRFFKKFSIALISAFSVLALSQVAFGVPLKYSDLEDKPEDKICTEEDVIKIAQEFARTGTAHFMWEKWLKNNGFNQFMCYDHKDCSKIKTYISLWGESCPIDGFAGKDDNNKNPRIKTLIYTSNSFDAQRYHRILALNNIVVDGKLTPNWSSRIISNFKEGQLHDLQIRFESNTGIKKIIFCFDPSVCMHRFLYSGCPTSAQEAVDEFNELLKGCGIEGEFAINFKTYCDINKIVSDDYGDSDNIEYDSKKYSSIEKLMENYNFRVLRSKGNIGMMYFCGNDSLVNIGLQGPVYEIGNYAFSCCKSLKNMILPKFVMKIGEGAFQYCESLQSINIPDYVTEIGKDAFNGCKNLKYIEYKGKVYNNAEDFMRAFNTKVLKVDGNIGFRQFLNREDLKNIDVKGPVHKIGNNAFERCVNLESIQIPDCVEEVGDGVFIGCHNLKIINYKGKIYHSAEEFKKAVNTKILEAEENINEEQFAGRIDLKNIEISGPVDVIGSRAFKNCSSLKNVVIPKGVRSIGMEAFMGCTSLRSINIPNSVDQIGIGAFGFCENLDHIEYHGKVFGSVREFLDEFMGKNKVLEIEGTISFRQFHRRQDLKLVEVRGNVFIIGDLAFEECLFLEEIDLPKGVRIIKEKAFKNCISLKRINIPSSVKNVKSSAFVGCSSLNQIEYKGNIYNSVEKFFKAFNDNKSVDKTEGQGE